MEKAFTNKNWSAQSKGYKSFAVAITELWANDALRIAHHQVAPLLDECKNDAAKSFNFLDVGCGPGVLSFEFARRYRSMLEASNVKITATDLSDGMLDLLREQLEKDPSLQQIAPRVSAVQMDGLTLEKVASDSVDMLGSNFGMSIFPNRSKAWASAQRVLKDDGLLVVTAWNEQSAQMRWTNEVTKLFNAAGGSEEDGEVPLSLSAVSTDSKRVADELCAAGFRGVEAYLTSHTIILDDLQSMVQQMSQNPFSAAYREKLTLEQIQASLTASIKDDARANFSAAAASSDEESRPLLVNWSAFTIVARK